MLEAVLFDWGDTLMRWAWQPELLAAGHTAGLAALGREPEPALTERFVEDVLPDVLAPGRLDEVEYPALVRSVLGELGIDVDEGGLERYLEAEHAAWSPARQLAGTTHALLETLRERGLRLALVSNALDPPWLLHRDLAELGVAERLDAAVFSSEVGFRKPHAAIFERALELLGGPDPARVLMVGDRPLEDVGGASALGMRTCQALWFAVHDASSGPEPDFRAFTQMDVVTVAQRLS